MLRIMHSRPEETVLGLYIFEAAALGGVHIRASSHPVAASSVDQISTSYAVIGRWTNTKYLNVSACFATNVRNLQNAEPSRGGFTALVRVRLR